MQGDPVAGTVYSAMAGTLPVTLESAALLRTLLSPLNILILVAACFCALPLLPRIKAFASGESAGASVLRIASYGAAIGIFLLCVLNLSSTQFNPFIYFRF